MMKSAGQAKRKIRSGEALAASLLERLERLPLGRFHWILLATIFLGTAFDNMDQITLSFVIPAYRQEWGVSAELAALHPALGLGGTLIGAFLWGWIADRIGRKAAFIWTIVLFAVTSFINGFSWSFWQVTASCFVMGIGVGGEVPLAFTLISEYMPARLRGRTEVLVGMLAISTGYAIASLGAILFLPLEGQQFAFFPLGWRTIFLIGVIPSILITVIRRHVPESPRWLISKGRVEEATAIVENLERQLGVRTSGAAPMTAPVPASVPAPVPASANPGVPGPGRRPRNEVAALWSGIYRRRTAMTTIYGVTWGFFNFGFLIWLPTLLHNAGYGAVESARYASIINGVAVPGAFLSAWLFHRWSTKKTLAVYPLAAGLLMLAFGWLASGGLLSVGLLIAIGAMIFLTGAALAGLFPAYVSEIYPTELRATGSGWAVSLSRLGAVSGPLVGGVLVGAGIPLFGHSLVYGLPLLIAAGAMAWLGLETRGKRLEEIAEK